MSETHDEDAARIRDDQRAAWDSVAAGWRKWWRTFEANAQVVNDRLVELAGVCVGDRVLDIATGIGEPALTAAAAVGPTGQIIATDLSPQMLEMARERAARAGFAHVDLVCADAECLALPPASFAAALCRWGLMLLPDPATAARRIRDVLRPGGRFAAAVWAAPDQVPLLSLPRRVLLRELALPTPDADAPGPFRLCDPTKLVRILEGAGFVEVEWQALSVSFSFESAASYLEFTQELSTGMQKTLAERTIAEQERVLEQIEAEAAKLCEGSYGPVFENRVLCVVARRAP